jgi:hypothetical protein
LGNPFRLPDLFALRNLIEGVPGAAGYCNTPGSSKPTSMPARFRRIDPSTLCDVDHSDFARIVCLKSE